VLSEGTTYYGEVHARSSTRYGTWSTKWSFTDENLEELVVLVNEELQSASCGLKDRLDAVDTELMDVRVRLSKLYAALQTCNYVPHAGWLMVI